MKRYPIAILGLRNAKAPMRRGRRDKSPGGPDAAGAKRNEEASGGEAPPSKRLERSRAATPLEAFLCSRLDRSVQTDAQAEPARPDDGTASGASALEACLDLCRARGRRSPRAAGRPRTG